MRIKLEKIVNNSGANIIGSSIGLVFAGPLGSLVGSAISPIISGVLSGVLTEKEKNRVEAVADLAVRLINERIKNGQKPTSNASSKKAKELFEGVLLKAKETYEEKKLPLLANLFATAPFTNTPIENILQTLLLADQLSYRELCIVAVIGQNQHARIYSLNNRTFKEKFSPGIVEEAVSGVYFDILQLINSGVLIQMEEDNQHITNSLVAANIVPQRLRLYYPGSLLFISMQLDTIDGKDLKNTVDYLR